MATRGDSLQEGTGCSFEEEWPEIALRLERFLAARGVDGWLRADVVQETAARVYPRWDTLDHSVPLWNLVVTVALRVLHNHRRKEARIELVSDPVPVQKDDVDVRGLHRAQLDKTRSAMRHLTDDQRRVLLAELGEAPVPTGSRGRVNVLRLRARARLREALGPWAPSAIALELRHLRARIAHKSATLETHAPAMASALVNIAIAATLAIAGAGGVEKSAQADTAAFVQPERARLLSLAKPRNTNLDPAVGIERPESPRVLRTKGHVKEDPSGVPYVVGNTRENAARLAGLARKRTDYMKKLAENQAEGKRQLAERRAEYGKDVAEDRVEHGREWVEDRLP